MKSITKALLLLSASLAPIRGSDVPASEMLYIGSFYGGFDGSSDVTVMCGINNYQKGLILTAEYFNTQYGTRFMVQTVDIDDNLDRTKKRLKFPLLFKGNMFKTGPTIDMYIGSKNKPLWENKFTIYPKISETINTKNYIKKQYVIKDTILTYTNLPEWVDSESYDFTNTLDIISNDKNNALEIMEINFSHYPLIDNLDNNGSCYLVIKDQYDIYKNIDKIETNKIKIPVNIIRNDKIYCFEFKNEMYVNPNNLQMSFRQIDGFIKTSNFYVPLGKLDSLQDSEIYFELNKIGMNDTTVKMPLSFVNGRNLFGACYNSTYCIEGEVKK